MVDDDKDILTISKKGLEASNYKVHAFDNPFGAIAYIKSTNGLQLLISDIWMPTMTGFELARSVKDHNPEMNIIFLTACELSKSKFDKYFQPPV